jgi:hypothetical protein
MAQLHTRLRNEVNDVDTRFDFINCGHVIEL